MSEFVFAFRMLRRSPFTSGLIILTLALGVSATVAIYTVVQGVLLRDLPYPAADRLVLVWRSTTEDPVMRGALSPRDLLDVSAEVTAFSHIGAVNSFSTSFVPPDAPAEQVQLGVVSGDFFGAVGVPPLLGRTLEPADDRPLDTRDPETVSVVVLSHDFWIRHFGGDGNAVGRTIRFGGSRMTVVGVMPEAFAVQMPVGSGMSTDLVGWTPLGVNAQTASRDGAYLKVWARLKPGTTRQVAQAQLAGAAARLRAAHSAHEETGYRLRAESLEQEVVAHASSILMLLGLTGMVTLLVACANAAGLLLVQHMGRMQEMSVRAALGATRGRIIRQLTTEAAVLSFGGAFLGVALAAPAVPLLLGLDPGLIPESSAIRLDAGVLAFAVAVALLATALSGTVPAVVLAHARLEHIVRSRAAVTRGSRRLRSFAVGGQIAGALLLTYASASLAETLRRWENTDYGFTTAGVHAFEITLPFLAYQGPDTWVRFFDDLRQRLSALPTAAAVAAGSDLPMDGNLTQEPWLPTDLTGTTSWGERTALHRSVSPGYFETAGIDVLEGRSFTESDRDGAPPVVVVDREIARQLSEDRAGPVIGRRLDVTRHTFSGGYSVQRRTVEVVGVVRTVPHDHPDARPAGMLYLPQAQYPLWSMTLLVRGHNGRMPDAAQVRRTVAEADPGLPVIRERPLEAVISSKLAPTRFLLALVAMLGLVVAGLAGAGLFGTVAESVRQGHRDLGIRLALGATGGRVVNEVVMRGLSMLALGLLAGAFVTPVVGRIMADTIQTRDSWSASALAGATLLILGVGLVACYVPARRAAGIDPLRTMRDE
jgi:putative ABC transport system permease protein